MSVESSLRGLKYEPALILYGVNAAVAAALAFGLFNLTTTTAAAVTVILTAVLGIITAAVTRPVNVSVITAAFATGLTALGAFGLHLSITKEGSLVALLSVVLSLLLRVHVSPSVRYARTQQAVPTAVAQPVQRPVTPVVAQDNAPLPVTAPVPQPVTEPSTGQTVVPGQPV